MGKAIFESSPAPDVSPRELSKKEKENFFWTSDNLVDIFMREAEELKKEYERRELIEKDKNLSAEARREQLIALGKKSPGLFLIKLWSAVDLGIRKVLDEHLEDDDDDDTDTRKEIEKELRKVFLDIPRVTNFVDKAQRALAIKELGHKIGVEIGGNQEGIDRLAEENEKYALKELQLIKNDPEDSPLNYRRNEANVSKPINNEEIPNFSARALLEDWRVQHELKFPGEKKNLPSEEIFN